MEYHTEKPDAYAVLKIKEFRLFLSARFVITVAVQMQSIIVGWQIYEMTKDPLSLGLIGLSEAIPFIFMAFFSGHIADTFNRRSIILSSLFVYMLCAVTLLLFTTHLDFILNHFHTLPIFIIIAINLLFILIIIIVICQIGHICCGRIECVFSSVCCSQALFIAVD